MTATIGSTGNILSLVSPTAAPIDEPNRPAFVSRPRRKSFGRKTERESSHRHHRRKEEEEEEASNDNL